MIDIDTGYSLSYVPYLKNVVLDEYAETLVFDFEPERLSIPGAIDTDSFIEYYLNLTLYYYRICNNRKVQGMTAFNAGVVEVMDEINGSPFELAVEKGVVIIEPMLLERHNQHHLRFTMMHEGSHWLLHRNAFAVETPFGPAGLYANQFLAAQDGRGDYLCNQKERNDIDCMESQADYLSAAILMPRPALRIAFEDFFSIYNVSPQQIIRGRSFIDDAFVVLLPKYISCIFNVSTHAALIRLEKLRAIIDAS